MPDITTMDLTQLEELRGAIEHRIAELKQGARRELLARIENDAARLGISRRQLLTGAEPKRRGRKPRSHVNGTGAAPSNSEEDADAV